MAGAPAEITFSQTYNTQAQAAALIISANNNYFNHQPPTTCTCYSTTGDDGADNSNLFLSTTGVPAIDGYMRDPGTGNSAVGHRRWILHPTTRNMGTGDISGSGAVLANALYVYDEPHFSDPKPTLRDGFVAWPPPGYVPYDIAYPRWHISLDNANFSNAIVSMTSGGQNIPVAIESRGPGLRDQYIAWRVNGMPDYASFPLPTSDTSYSVVISNALVGGIPQQLMYTVTLFDPSTGGLLVGDYNRNGSVGPEDYSLWKSTFGAIVGPGTGADGNNDGHINAADYVVWRRHTSSGSASATSLVPEPSAVHLMLVTLIVCLSRTSGLNLGTSRNEL
jgi:hypothetical protein